MDMGHAMVGAEQKAQSTLNGWTRQLDMGAWDNAAHKVQSYKKENQFRYRLERQKTLRRRLGRQKTLNGGGRAGENGDPASKVRSKGGGDSSWWDRQVTADLGVGREWETTKPSWQHQARETENPAWEGGQAVCTGDSA